MNHKGNILICPLEWGLGHAGRMIPVAAWLSGAGYNVIIGSGKAHTDFFRNELKGLNYIDFPGFRIRYSSRVPQYVVIFLATPKFIFWCIKEHLLLKSLIRDKRIDIVISDSRLGLWNRSITTVLVTHMLKIPHPSWLGWLEERGLWLVRKVTSRFSFVFVPDLPGDINASGKLSHGFPVPGNARYIGLLSRFSTGSSAVKSGHDYHCAVILSGPEPQRSAFRKRAEAALLADGRPSVIFEGLPSAGNTISKKGNITCISHMPADQMYNVLMGSRVIVTRSGYSTIMELLCMGRSALIIPTPGQSEQEYLAQYLSGKGWFSSIRQEELGGSTSLSEGTAAIPSVFNDESRELLAAALNELLKQKH